MKQTSETMPKVSTLQSMLGAFSEEHLPREARRQVRQLFDHLDNMLFLDEMGALSVDRKAFIALANDETQIPVDLRDIVILETSKHLGRSLKAFTKGKGTRITWQEGEMHGVPIRPIDPGSLGITALMSVEEMHAVVRAQVPQIPDSWFTTDTKQIVDTVRRQFTKNRTVWDCLVNHLGWWAALTVVFQVVIWIGVIGGILSGGAVAPLVIMGIVLSLMVAGAFATAYVILCILNPDLA